MINLGLISASSIFLFHGLININIFKNCSKKHKNIKCRFQLLTVLWIPEITLKDYYSSWIYWKWAELIITELNFSFQFSYYLYPWKQHSNKHCKWFEYNAMPKQNTHSRSAASVSLKTLLVLVSELMNVRILGNSPLPACASCIFCKYANWASRLYCALNK